MGVRRALHKYDGNKIYSATSVCNLTPSIMCFPGVRQDKTSEEGAKVSIKFIISGPSGSALPGPAGFILHCPGRYTLLSRTYSIYCSLTKLFLLILISVICALAKLVERLIFHAMIYNVDVEHGHFWDRLRGSG